MATKNDDVRLLLSRIDRRLRRIEHDISAMRAEAEDEWIDAQRVSTMLAITTRALAPDRLPPGFPPASRVGRRRLWRRSDIELWRSIGGARGNENRD